MLLSASQFAHSAGIAVQVARRHLSKGTWRGHPLPVVALDGQKGGEGGKTWGLRVDLCSPAMRALLGLAETLPSTMIDDRLQGRAEDWQISIAADKYRILTPVLLTPPGSPESANAIRDLAAQPAHQIGGKWMPVAERTLYDWLNAAESDVSALLPAPRSDRGQRRVRISRAWDAGCGLPAEVQDQIAGKVTLGARSVVYNDGASIREALRLAGKELCRQTAEAGSPLKPRQLQGICDLNSKWADRIAGQVNAFLRAILAEYYTETSSSADAEEAMWNLLAWRPFSAGGR